MVLFSSVAFAEVDRSPEAVPEDSHQGIQVTPASDLGKEWIHEFETLPLGAEMDHLEKMKEQRPHQFAVK